MIQKEFSVSRVYDYVSLDKSMNESLEKGWQVYAIFTRVEDPNEHGHDLSFVIVYVKYAKETQIQLVTTPKEKDKRLFELILAQKEAYYGPTAAAYDFAEEEYNNLITIAMDMKRCNKCNGIIEGHIFHDREHWCNCAFEEMMARKGPITDSVPGAFENAHSVKLNETEDVGIQMAMANPDIPHVCIDRGNGCIICGKPAIDISHPIEERPNLSNLTDQEKVIYRHPGRMRPGHKNDGISDQRV